MPSDDLIHPWTLLLEEVSFPSREELVVMKAAMEGNSLKDAAKELSLSSKEVKDLLKIGMKRANIRDLYELIVFGLKNGIIKDEPIDITDIEKQFEKKGFYESYPLWLYVMNQVAAGKSIQQIGREGEGGSKTSIQNAIKQITDKFNLGESPAKFIRFSLAALNPIKPNPSVRGFKPHVSWAQKQGVGSTLPLMVSKFRPFNIDPEIPVYNAAGKRDMGGEENPKVPQAKMSYADSKKLPPPVVRSTSIQTALWLLGINKSAITPNEIQGSFWNRPSSYLWNLLELAKRRYELEISAAHPDKTGGDYRRAAQLTSAWDLVKKLFARRGYELNKR